MKTKLLLILVGFLCLQISYSQTSITLQRSSVLLENVQLNEKFEQYYIVQTSSKNWVKNLENGEENFYLEFGNLLNEEISLFSNTIISEEAFTQISTQDGVLKKKSSQNNTYEGYCKKGNEVRLTVSDNFVLGSIKTANNNWFIEPLYHFTENAPYDTYLLYKGEDVKKHVPIGCAFDEVKKNSFEYKNNINTNTQQGLCRELEMAIACDAAVYTAHGATQSSVETYLASILNLVEGDYNNSFDFDIDYIVVSYYIETVPNSTWTTLDDSFELLYNASNSFVNWANGGGFGTTAYDLGSLWTGRDLTSTSIVPPTVNTGLALGYCDSNGCTGAVCTIFRYNVLEDLTQTYGSATSQDMRALQTHEIGHNFDANHDGVNGNIMQGVSNIGSPPASWSSNSITEINNYMNTITTSCWDDCTGNTSCLSPTGLSSSSITSSSASISWNAGTGAISYNIRYRVTGNSTWLYTTSSGTSTTLSSLSSCSNYEFQVESVCDGGTVSGYSGLNFFSTTGCTSSCDTPTNLSVNPSSNSAVLSWDVVGAANSYLLQFRLVGTNWGTFSTPSNITNITGLSACNSYEFRVASECTGQTSSYSNIVSFVTDGCACPASQNVTANYSSGTTIITASNSITATNLISGTANVTYSAGTEILLLDGFYAFEGTQFLAYIEGCVSSNESPDNSFDLKSQVISNKLDFELLISPNPTSGSSFLNIEGIDGQINEVQVKIIDIRGKTMSENRFSIDNTQFSVELDLSDFAPNLYFVEVFFPETGMREVRKVVLDR